MYKQPGFEFMENYSRFLKKIPKKKINSVKRYFWLIFVFLPKFNCAHSGDLKTDISLEYFHDYDTSS